MSALQSKVDICNIALNDLGIRTSIEDIDIPKKDNEIICARYYDVTRQYVLKRDMPNFALTRLVVSQKTLPPAYINAYGYAFEYPVRCLKLLGVGNIDLTDNTDADLPTVESGLILTNTAYPDGMPIRIVDDIEDVTMMTADFIFTLAKEIAKRISLPTTQDLGKKKVVTQEAATEQLNAAALNAQENKPIRRSVSRFRQSRSFNVSQNPSKS